jgi:lactoylglutathione lyase
VKFGYTILYVKDVERTVSFFEAAFGLKRNFVHESGYGELATGDTKLAFASLEMALTNGVSIRPVISDEPAPAVELAFIADDVVAAYATAVRAGATPVSQPKQKPWGQTVGYVRDLNGFLIEICSPV